MNWSNTQAEQYEHWFTTPKGRFVLDRESRLLQRMISTWPRRKQKLVDIGCGAGHFAHMFWEWGFDVSGIDASPAMLKRARVLMDKHMQLQVGVAERLPYDDNEFDFAALITVLEFCDDPVAAIAEAARVARKGLVIGFLNRYSLYYLLHVRSQRKLLESVWAKSFWFSWWEMQRCIISALGRQSLCARSVLPGPMCSWRATPLFKQLGGVLLPPYLGAFVTVRIDLLGEPVKTPLMAWNTEPSL
ncbi:MAG: methyltransferase domain-containing protein [Desulfoplanes sp.]|nr:methyltransferase domain-containing protein [Desulfoplanes sp.]